MADRLPQPLAADVLEHAREAFTQALQAAATLSSVLVIVAAVTGRQALVARPRTAQRGRATGRTGRARDRAALRLSMRLAQALEAAVPEELITRRVHGSPKRPRGTSATAKMRL